LLDHDTSQIVGQSTRVGIDSNGVTLDGLIMGEDAAALRVITLAKKGFNWQASIGASIVRHEYLKAGESTKVNGRDVAGPAIVVKEARLKETSFVALGADSSTSAAVDAKAVTLSPAKGVSTMTPFQQWLQAKGISHESLDDATRAALQASYDAEEAAKRAKAPPSLEDVLATHEAENERINTITQMTEVMLRDRPALYAEVSHLSRTAIESHASVKDYELVLWRLRATAGTSARRVTAQDSVSGPEVIEAAVCQSGRLAGIESEYEPNILKLARKQFPNGIGLMDLIIMAARENGYTSPTNRDLASILRAAFGVGRNYVQANDFSTLTLPGMLSNIANKFLLQGFNAVEAGWRMLAVIKPVKDFKTMTSYSLTGGLQYEKVGPTGELKHGTLGELAYADKADTYGKILGITRQDLINDDLGALSDTPKKLGRGAALKLNDVFWSTFMNNSTFFTSARKNVSTGAGSALTSAGLTAASTAFRKLTDADGYPTGVMPKILTVPVELETIASELLTSQFINTGGASTTDKVPNKNIWAGKFAVVSSSYLSNPAYTGNSTTAWYLSASPDDLPLISVCFLNGREVPIVESADAEFNTLGIVLRGYHDFGANLQEFRAGVRAAGA
jgi:hypothetical protein